MIQFRVRGPGGNIRTVRRHFDDALVDMARMGPGALVETREGVTLATRHASLGAILAAWDDSAGKCGTTLGLFFGV